MSGDSVAFDVRNLTKIYGEGEAEVRALRGVSTVIKKGQLIVLLGPSGSGKSTLLNILGGLDYATEGQVFYNGEDLAEMGDRRLTEYRRNNIGFIFQNYNLMPGLTARENVELVTEIAKNPMNAVDALDLVGLSHRVDHFPSQLSGGEQQRVAIARAIAKQPEVLFCDEPTGALDSKTSLLVLEALNRVVEAIGTTMLMVTHHQGIAPLADRVIHFKDGRIDQEVVNSVRAHPAEIHL